jgi:hypothetical protein
MKKLQEAVEKFGAGKDSYAIIHDYHASTCVEVLRVIQWDGERPTKWNSEMIKCSTWNNDGPHYVRTAWNYNKNNEPL